MEFVEQSKGESSRTVLKTSNYWVHTDIGNFIDTMCGNSAYVWGYSDPRLTKAVVDQLHGVQFLRGRNNETNDLVASVNQDLLAMSGMSGIIWAVSGSDGVEAGLELSHQYWQVKGPDKDKVIAFTPGYHGCTLLAKTLRGERVSNHSVVLDAPCWVTEEEHGVSDSQTLAQVENILKIDQTIGSIIMESVPWINGIYPWSQTWWTGIRKLCDQYNVLLIVDDVWGGFGKVGPAFSHTMYNVSPDIVIMGKSLTGGYVPLSCALSNQRVTDVVNNNNWLHGHTWQPQMLGIALARQVIDMFDYEQVKQINQKQIEMIARLGTKFRGTGLTKEIITSKTVTKQDFEHAGLCNTQYTQNSVILVTPFCADDEYWFELENRLGQLL